MVDHHHRPDDALVARLERGGEEAAAAAKRIGRWRSVGDEHGQRFHRVEREVTAVVEGQGVGADVERDAVRAGFGSVGELGTLYGLPAPSADLPPLQLRLVGSGGPGHPGITVAPLLPPSGGPGASSPSSAPPLAEPLR